MYVRWMPALWASSSWETVIALLVGLSLGFEWLGIEK